MLTRHWKLIFSIIILMISAVGCAATASTSSTPPDVPKQTWYVDTVRFRGSAHAGLECTECHRDLSMNDVPEKHPVSDNLSNDAITTFDYRSCARCHPQEYASYQQGFHAEVLEGTRRSESEFDAPRCGNCHSPHYEQANRSRLQLIAFQSEMCGSCHPVERETYLQNYHGKAATLGDQNSPSCTDCHGGHHVASLVETQDALVVCQQCHPATTSNMAGFIIHAQETIAAPTEKHAGEFTMLFFAKVLLMLIISGVLAFFYAHTLLWFIRSAHKRLRGG